MKKILILLLVLFFTTTVSADCTFDFANIKKCTSYSWEMKKLNTILYKTFVAYENQSNNKTILAAKIGKMKKWIEIFEQKILDGSRITNRIEYIVDYLSFIIGLYLDTIEKSKDFKKLSSSFFDKNNLTVLQVTGIDLTLKKSEKPLEIINITPYNNATYQQNEALQLSIKVQNNTMNTIGLKNFECASLTGMTFSDITTVKAKPYKITNLIGYMSFWSGFQWWTGKNSTGNMSDCFINYTLSGTQKTNIIPFKLPLK